MFEGGYYLIKWFKGIKDIEVVVKIDYMLNTNGKYEGLQQAKATVFRGEFKGLTAFFDDKDIVIEFGTLEDFNKNHAEYLV